MPLSDRPEARARQLANLRAAPPPPELGNGRATKHGGRATHKTLPVASVASRIYELLARETPLRDADGELPPADRTAVELLALCLSRLESIAHWVELHGVLDEHGEPRSVLDYERRLRAEALDHCKQLGLTPRARVALGLDVQRGKAAFTLAEILSDLPEEGETRE